MSASSAGVRVLSLDSPASLFACLSEESLLQGKQVSSHRELGIACLSGKRDERKRLLLCFLLQYLEWLASDAAASPGRTPVVAASDYLETRELVVWKQVLLVRHETPSVDQQPQPLLPILVVDVTHPDSFADPLCLYLRLANLSHASLSTHVSSIADMRFYECFSGGESAVGLLRDWRTADSVLLTRECFLWTSDADQEATFASALVMHAFGDVCREHQSSRLLLAQRVSRDVFLDREADSLVACVVRDFARDMRKEIEASGSFQVEDLASLYQRFRRRALNRLLSLRGSSAETLTRVHLTSVRMREEFAKLESAVEAIASLRIECLNSQLAHAYALVMQQQLNSGCIIPAGELQRLHRQQLHASLKALKAQAPAADTLRLMHRIKQLFSLMQRVNQETEGERESARQVMRSLSQAVDDRVHRVVKLAAGAQGDKKVRKLLSRLDDLFAQEMLGLRLSESVVAEAKREFSDLMRRRMLQLLKETRRIDDRGTKQRVQSNNESLRLEVLIDDSFTTKAALESTPNREKQAVHQQESTASKRVTLDARPQQQQELSQTQLEERKRETESRVAILKQTLLEEARHELSALHRQLVDRVMDKWTQDEDVSRFCSHFASLTDQLRQEVSDLLASSRARDSDFPPEGAVGDDDDAGLASREEAPVDVSATGDFPPEAAGEDDSGLATQDEVPVDTSTTTERLVKACLEEYQSSMEFALTAPEPPKQVVQLTSLHLTHKEKMLRQLQQQLPRSVDRRLWLSKLGSLIQEDYERRETAWTQARKACALHSQLELQLMRCLHFFSFACFKDCDEAAGDRESRAHRLQEDCVRVLRFLTQEAPASRAKELEQRLREQMRDYCQRSGHSTASSDSFLSRSFKTARELLVHMWSPRVAAAAGARASEKGKRGSKSRRQKPEDLLEMTCMRYLASMLRLLDSGADATPTQHHEAVSREILEDVSSEAGVSEDRLEWLEVEMKLQFESLTRFLDRDSRRKRRKTC